MIWVPDKYFQFSIKDLYKSTGNCDYQQQYKSILGAEVVSTPEIFTKNSPMSPGPSVTFKNPSARKSIRLFTEVFDVKNKTVVRRVGADKLK